MRLSDLTVYKKISIQCHDNPDADTLASAYGLYLFFKERNINVRIIYSGNFKIQKTNLVAMITKLNIPIEYTTELHTDGLLITVDCQYGAGNVTPITADYIAVFDHHPIDHNNPYQSEINSSLGSCATLIWHLLIEEDFDVNSHPLLATALYYGLFSDTNAMSELQHPLDRDMHDQLAPDLNLIKKLNSSNLSLKEIEIAGLALLRYSYNETYHFAIVKAQPCDPNILGLISDMVLQVDAIDVCIVFSELEPGIKFSVRSCEKEVQADELARYLSQHIGSGGGHHEKAGGFINYQLFKQHYPDSNLDGYFHSRLNCYFKSYRVIYAAQNRIDTQNMPLYQKKLIPFGFVKTTDVFPSGTSALVRTLECDIQIDASEDTYIMVGILGEVYPIKTEQFKLKYSPVDQPFKHKMSYVPSIRNLSTGEVVELTDYIHTCLPTQKTYIYAEPAAIPTKIFTLWNSSEYMYGDVGDYIAVAKDNPNDIYIIQKDIFPESYERVTQ